MKNLQKSFENAKQEDLNSGSLKFSVDFVSNFKLFEVATDWLKTDERVKALAIRSGGGNQIALDFRYDTSGLPRGQRRGNTLDKLFKPYFKEKLGGDYMIGWDYGSPTIVIK